MVKLYSLKMSFATFGNPGRLKWYQDGTDYDVKNVFKRLFDMKINYENNQDDM